MAAAGDNWKRRTVTKSYFNVLGLCCSSEVPLVEKMLRSLDSIVSVSVIVPSRTVIVVHDSVVHEGSGEDGVKAGDDGCDGQPLKRAVDRLEEGGLEQHAAGDRERDDGAIIKLFIL